MLRGEGIEVIRGVSAQEVFDFVLDPSQYTKADTKIIWVTKLGETPDGMIAREDGKFLDRFPGAVITRYRWTPPHSIDVTLEFGFPKHLHAWFEIEEVDGGTRVRHVEEFAMGKGPLGWFLEAISRRWWAEGVRKEVAEIRRLMEAGERGHGPGGPGEPTRRTSRAATSASGTPGRAREDLSRPEQGAGPAGDPGSR